MDYEINEEYKTFLEEIESRDFEIGRYLDESNYEDEYSHNDIDKSMGILADKIREYLHEKHPNKFVVTTGWCIHVMTPERARQSRVSERTISLWLVK
jgi:hypothetical protein